MAVLRSRVSYCTWHDVCSISACGARRLPDTTCRFGHRRTHVSAASRPFMMTFERSIAGAAALFETELLETGKFSYSVHPKLPIATTWRGIFKASWCSSHWSAWLSNKATCLLELNAMHVLLKLHDDMVCKVPETSTIKWYLRSRKRLNAWHRASRDIARERTRLLREIPSSMLKNLIVYSTMQLLRHSQLEDFARSTLAGAEGISAIFCVSGSHPLRMVPGVSACAPPTCAGKGMCRCAVCNVFVDVEATAGCYQTRLIFCKR